MEKKNFISLLLCVIGGLFFAIGMCMCLIPEWEAFTYGVVVAIVGAVVLLSLFLVRRKASGKSIQFNGKAIVTVLFGMLGTLVFGAGMCMIMVYDMMLAGIAVGVVGIILLLCLIPVVKGLK